jgi:hypothetical protein
MDKGEIMQIVQVKILGGPRRTYAYGWNGAEPLKIYDWVYLPGNPVTPDGGEGMVAALGTDGYTGPLKVIISLGVSPLDWVRDAGLVNSKEEASALWRRAKAAGVSSAALKVIESEGWARLGRLERERLGRLAREHGIGS